MVDFWIWFCFFVLVESRPGGVLQRRAGSVSRVQGSGNWRGGGSLKRFETGRHGVVVGGDPGCYFWAGADAGEPFCRMRAPRCCRVVGCFAFSSHFSSLRSCQQSSVCQPLQQSSVASTTSPPSPGGSPWCMPTPVLSAVLVAQGLPAAGWLLGWRRYAYGANWRIVIVGA